MEAAAAPPTNPYALMFGMDDAESLPNQIRGLIQDIRNTEPALAERITRAVCGGDAVAWTSPAGAYTTAAGNVYLKSIAAKIAGGTLALSSDGTAESVDGVKVESLALQHTLTSKIENAQFSNADNLAEDANINHKCTLGTDATASNRGAGPAGGLLASLMATKAGDFVGIVDGEVTRFQKEEAESSSASARNVDVDAVPALLKGTVDSVLSFECDQSPEEPGNGERGRWDGARDFGVRRKTLPAENLIENTHDVLRHP